MRQSTCRYPPVLPEGSRNPEANDRPKPTGLRAILMVLAGVRTSERAGSSGPWTCPGPLRRARALGLGTSALLWVPFGLISGSQGLDKPSVMSGYSGEAPGSGKPGMV